MSNDNILTIVPKVDKQEDKGSALESHKEMMDEIQKYIEEQGDSFEGSIMVTVCKSSDGTSLNPSLFYVNMSKFEIIGILRLCEHAILKETMDR